MENERKNVWHREPQTHDPDFCNNLYHTLYALLDENCNFSEHAAIFINEMAYSTQCDDVFNLKKQRTILETRLDAGTIEKVRPGGGNMTLSEYRQITSVVASNRKDFSRLLWWASSPLLRPVWQFFHE